MLLIEFRCFLYDFVKFVRKNCFFLLRHVLRKCCKRTYRKAETHNRSNHFFHCLHRIILLCLRHKKRTDSLPVPLYKSYAVVFYPPFLWILVPESGTFIYKKRIQGIVPQILFLSLILLLHIRYTVHTVRYPVPIPAWFLRHGAVFRSALFLRCYNIRRFLQLMHVFLNAL